MSVSRAPLDEDTAVELEPDEDAGSRSRKRAVFGWLIRLAVGVGILFFLFSFIPFSDVVAALSAAGPGWVALAMVIMAAERWLAAVRTTILSDHAGIPLSVGRNLEISLAATFYGTILPGDLAGGAVRWYKMSRPNGMRAEAAAVLTFDRLIATAVLLLTGVGFWLLESPPLSSRALEIGFLVLLAGILAGMGLLLSGMAAPLFLAPLASLAHRFGLRFFYEALEKILGALQSFSAIPPGRATTLLGVTVARQLLAVGIMYAFALALSLDVGFISLGWMNAFLNVAMMLPVSVSGLGVREGAMVFALAPYGVVGSAAVALSFLLLLSHIVVAAAGGLVELKAVLAGTRDVAPPTGAGI